MTDDPQATLTIFANAVRELLQDGDLAYANPGEQAIVGRLANLLDGKFDGWSVNVEWNRREDAVKRLGYDLGEDVLRREGAIRPDLIVHKIGSKENLLVVEVKKSTNRDFENDVWKLKGMTQQAGEYAYSVGLHLVVDMPAGTAPRCDVYIDAGLDEGLTNWLREQLP